MVSNEQDGLDIREALYTTRAMRRFRPDPVPPDAQARILDAAIRAPSSGNEQHWRFILVDDRDIMRRIGALYQHAWSEFMRSGYVERTLARHADRDAGQRVLRSAQHLADHFGETPLLLFGFIHGDRSGSSIYPALWSAILAARAEGVGGTLTTTLEYREDLVRELLGVPKGWQMAGCIALGYPRGRWAVAPRRPVHEVAARNGWGGDLGFTVPEPLWPPAATGDVPFADDGAQPEIDGGDSGPQP